MTKKSAVIISNIYKTFTNKLKNCPYLTFQEICKIYFDILKTYEQDIYKNNEIKYYINDELNYILKSINQIEKDMDLNLKSCQIKKANKEIKYLEKQIDVLQKELYYDDLTKALNRKWLFKIFLKNQDIFPGEGQLIFLDLNDFKTINDTYGHNTGDMVLKVFTKTLFDILKEDEHLIRFGGDEFIILTPNQDIDNRIEKVKRTLSDKNYISNYFFTPIEINFSYGRIDFQTNDNIYCKLEEVDKKMYKDKKISKLVRKREEC